MRRAFTMIELMICIAIVAIIVAIVAPAVFPRQAAEPVKAEAAPAAFTFSPTQDGDPLLMTRVAVLTDAETGRQYLVVLYPGHGAVVTPRLPKVTP